LGLAAGVGAIILFILLLKRAYSGLGKTLAVVRSSTLETSNAEFLLWGLGVVLAVHITNWFGITYFDQMYVVWFMQLAVVSTLSEQRLRLPDGIVKDAVETEIDHVFGTTIASNSHYE
jgi:hypothetical protein